MSVISTTEYPDWSPVQSTQPQLSTTENVIVLSWTSIIAFIAIFWNAIVLVSSVKYNAIRLDRISIILIRNLAISDLGYGVYMVISLVNLVYKRAVLGSVPCYIATMISHSLLAASCCFLVALNVSKLIALLFPLQSTTRSFERGYKISILIWTLIVVCHIAYILAVLIPGDFNVKYDYNSFKCTATQEARASVILGTLINVMFTLIPILLILVTTVWMLRYVMPLQGIQRQGVVTLIVVSAVFFFSLLPAITYFILRQVLSETVKSAAWFSQLYRVILLAICINSAANPLCYLMTVHSFGAFIKMKLKAGRKQLMLMLRLRSRLNRMAAILQQHLTNINLQPQ